VSEQAPELQILVVEDESSVGEVVRDVASGLGYVTHVVTTAEAALDALKRNSFDIALVDLWLPRMSSLDFLRTDMVRNRGLYVIGLSGVPTPDTEIRAALQLGAADILKKPLSAALVRDVLCYLLGSTRMLDHRRSPRLPHVTPVQIAEFDQPAWEGSSIDLSVFGVRLHADRPHVPGRVVKVAFTPPDGDRALELFALPVWNDGENYAFRFTNLSATEHERLHHVVAQAA
jgi:CheY-like chemotaxis protein